jgi:hypothetical protein
MHIIGTYEGKDRLFCDFGLEEVLMATKTIMLLKKSGYTVIEVSEEEYKSRLEKFKKRTASRKSD